MTILRVIAVIALTPLLYMYFLSAQDIPLDWAMLGFPSPEKYPETQGPTDLFENGHLGLVLLDRGITPDSFVQLCPAMILLLALGIAVLTQKRRWREVLWQLGPFVVWGVCYRVAYFWEARLGADSVISFIYAGAICSAFWVAIMFLVGWSHRRGSVPVAHLGGVILALGSVVMLGGALTLFGPAMAVGVFIQGLGLLFFSIAGLMRVGQPARPSRAADRRLP